ncbi:hypothetical protein [Promicromonospora soli]
MTITSTGSRTATPTTSVSSATAGSTDAEQFALIAALFPLVARPRPGCPSLSQRIDDIAEAGRAASTADDTAGALTAATRALNRAVLIAADCGDPGLARGLCRRHIDAYAGQPRALTTIEATRMLGPAINLARLRAGRGPDGVVTGLGLLLRAARDQVPYTIEGATLPLGNVHGSVAERRTMVNLVRSHLVVAGTTGLATASRWSDAVDVARAYGGIGRRLLEGRQTLILDRVTAGDLPTARGLIDQTVPQDAWERAVIACLTALCAAPQLRHEAMMVMLDQYRTSAHGTVPGDGDEHFRARHGLAVATIATSGAPGADLAVRRAGEDVAAQVVEQATESLDGYTAREVLRHRVTSRVATYQQHTSLARIVERSGLAGGTLIGKTRQRLTTAVEQALAAVRQAL